jgi:hypothetical protein
VPTRCWVEDTYARVELLVIDRNGSVRTHTNKKSRLENKTEEREGITMSLSKKIDGF